MALWADEITLIETVEPDERVNKNGFPNKPTEQPTTVYCNVKSVGYTERNSSIRTGNEVKLNVEVHTVDYSGQTVAEYKGKRYDTSETYQISDDIIELKLRDINQESES